MTTPRSDEDLVAVMKKLCDAPREVAHVGELGSLRAFLPHLSGLPGTVARSDYPGMRSGLSSTPASSKSLQCTCSIGENGRLDLGPTRMPWSEVRRWRAWIRFDELSVIGLGLEIEARSGLWRVEASRIHCVPWQR